MSSEKLRKYLAYYRKALNEDPENIEARLRLAALFREMGRPAFAIEEYNTAAKLLASDGLPLEAIAACKAILELDPTHQETQLFLAKLYAEVPEATGNSVRVARPVEGDDVSATRPRAGESSGRIDSVAVGPGDDDAGGEARPITLGKPKSETGRRPPAATSDEQHERTTTEEVTRRVRPTPPPEVESTTGADDGESTRVQSSHQQAMLRSRASADEDRQSIELGVFDMDNLGLEEESTGQWENLEALEEFEEPDTTEIVVGDEPSSPARREFRVSALPDIPLFSQLPRQVFVEVLDAMELKELTAGTAVIRPDDPASCLYVVVEGRVRVEKELLDGRVARLAKMDEGEVFGEFRLLTGQGGHARVVADTDVTLLAVSDEVIVRLGERYPKLWDVLWNFYYERMLNHALGTSALFRSLTPQQRSMVADNFRREHISAGEVVFERGEAVDSVLVVVRGSVQAAVPRQAGGGEQWRVVDTLVEGEFVGISPCARQMLATATVRAATDVVAYRMEGEIFRELMYRFNEMAEAVRDVIDARQARTPGLPDHLAATDRV